MARHYPRAVRIELQRESGVSQPPVYLQIAGQIRSAVEEFQCDHGLSVDGEVGPKTQRALVDAHGA